ncbi:MAG: bifunctional UDP-N-acetylglucosamine diphosphorylase/glucosamine-1-phosphate N-acetyltransferase GlmU [Actinomycetes bacterium]
MSTPRPAAVVVLAAGEGTRMKSSTPKVLHTVLGRSLLAHVLAAVAPLDAESTVVVIGHGREAVSAHLRGVAPEALEVVQDDQNGTGHAVRLALDAIPDAVGCVVVVCGDTPLLQAEGLSSLVGQHAEHDCAATVLTARLDDPTGYGRIIRNSEGRVTAIVEHRDADAAVLAITEVNSGIYVFDVQSVRAALGRLTSDNSQGEEYLTDVVALMVQESKVVEAVQVNDSDDVMGVNDRVQLAEADAVLRRRINEAWMRAGVTIVDPASTRIGPDVTIEPDVVIEPWTILEGQTSLARGAVVGPGAHLVDCQVASGASVRFTTADSVEIGPDSTVGPYTYLRPGTRLGRGARVGAFVETKNAKVGDGSKVPHLSYVGDAEIGIGSNIGAATVFVNYDGVEKHRTVIGDHVRVGSDTMLVAPVTIGDGAYTAAGSVITDDVPPGAMGVARARQRTIRDWVLRRRAGTKSAEAAEAAHSAAAEAGRDTGNESGDNASGNG